MRDPALTDPMALAPGLDAGQPAAADGINDGLVVEQEPTFRLAGHGWVGQSWGIAAPQTPRFTLGGPRPSDVPIGGLPPPAPHLPLPP